jgi:uncharacterized protein YfaS (alpha-2-macroglobulin family)
VGYKADGKLDYINAKQERSVEFIAVDNALKQKTANNLYLKLTEIQKISTLVKQYNGVYKYQTVTKEAELSTTKISIDKTGFNYAIDTETPGNFIVEIFDNQDRRLSRLSYSVVGYANLTGKLDKNAELQLKLNKPDYYPGDTIEMSIKAPYSGAGLITIETDKVHNFKWFKTDVESTTQTITIPSYLEGTAYVNVSFVRDVSSKEIFASPLSYAVVPFSIDKSKRLVKVTLKTEKIVLPGKVMKINYSTDKPSKVLIFAVDEGILQVAKYKLPKPLAHFLKKHALDVETLQILDLILPDFNLLKQLSATGGGVEVASEMEMLMKRALKKNLNPFTRKTDKPALYWSGIVDGTDNMQSVSFNVPDTFAGALRIMAVAVADEAVGSSSRSTIVRGPFVISPNVLTHVAPNDEFLVTVGLANIIDGSGDNAEIELVVKASKHLEILGKASTVLKIAEGSEGKFSFKVKAKQLLGAAKLSFTANYKNESMPRTTSLSVRPAMPYYTNFKSGYEEDGKVELSNNRRLYASLAEQSVAASASPLVLVDGLTSYLKNYPHSCTEQMVSKVFPLVGLMSHPAYAAHIDDAKAHFNQLIDKLRERQFGSGGFAFWQGQQKPSEYLTVYVMHFLTEAKELGYAVPNDMIQRGKSYLKSYIEHSAKTLGEARDRANAIYILTRLGVVTTNYLIDLEENLEKNYKMTWRTDILSAYMAATYQLLQKDQEANRLIDGYELNSSKHKMLDDFHSELAIDAQYIYLLAKHFKNKAKDIDGEIILQLSDKIFKGEYNTLSSAYSILALGAYSKLVLSNDFNENIHFSSLDSSGKKEQLKMALQPFMKGTYDIATQSVEIVGDKALFFLNVQSGFSQTLAKKAVSEGLEIYRDFIDENDNVITEFEQGKEITVKLKIRALENQSLQNIAVVDLLPGGFEIVRSSVSRTAHNWQADHIDIREDRIIYYGDFDSRVRELRYKVKLTSAGTFVIPPSYAESMYDRSIRAVSTAGQFTVNASQ